LKELVTFLKGFGGVSSIPCSFTWPSALGLLVVYWAAFLSIGLIHSHKATNLVMVKEYEDLCASIIEEGEALIFLSSNCLCIIDVNQNRCIVHLVKLYQADVV
jgi:hypothetical protein